MSKKAFRLRQEIRVNLGCGPNAPAGWLNVDGSWKAWLSNHVYTHKALIALGLIKKNSPGAQWNVRPLVHDITKRLPFENNTVSAIYGAHVLEHLYLVDARSLLGECRSSSSRRYNSSGRARPLFHGGGLFER